MKNAIPAFILVLAGCALYSCYPTPAKNQSEVEKPSYRESHRPQLHFSPPAKWMNDPNGMFYYEGEYHLFYQYYPDSTVWGPMHWGHAVTTDLVHWEHLPIALYPDSLGYIFSGSAVVDWHNTSGLGRHNEPPLVAIFTYHNPEMEQAGRSDFQYQGIAYSHDKGRTWVKYEGNPVIPNTEKIRDFRDPKVIWHEATAQWIMVFAAFDHVKFYGSPNLIHWTQLSDFGKEWGVHTGVWECPDLFPLRVENSDDTKWVLLLSINPGAPNGGSGTQYFVGDFDGTNFRLDPTFAPDVKAEQGVWLDYGRDNYAGVTWSDVPQIDGRRLFMGWMSNWDYAQTVPTAPWRSAMTLPRTLTLHQTSKGFRVFSKPVEELEKLRVDSLPISGVQIEKEFLVIGDGGVVESPAFANTAQFELILHFECLENTTPDFGIELSNSKGERYRIGYDAADQHYYSDRTAAGKSFFSDKFTGRLHTAPRISAQSTIKLHLFFDTASAELFADEGATVLTDVFFPSEDFNQMKIYCNNGKVALILGEVYGLKTIWP